MLAGIVIFHLLLIWGLANGLARRTMELIAPPIETKVIEEKLEEDKPPPPPPPKTEIPPVQMPPPIVEINVPMDAPNTTALSNTTSRPPPPAPPPPSASVPGTRAGLRKGTQPMSDDYYPPTSKRLEEQGSAIVEICVAETGKIAQEPVVKTSSKFPRLDEAAVKYAKALRVQAATTNGKPVSDCFNLRVKFELKNN
ncbi:MAG: TonB family protein [Steroidobacteraceae bacterium]